MRKKLLSVFLLLIGVVQSVSAQEPYAVLSSDNTTLTFYYDNQKASRGGMSVGPFESGSSPSWYEQQSSITSVVFDDSFVNCTSITSTARWFSSCKNLSTITGLEKLNTANVTDMHSMFSKCSSLSSVDVSHFNTAKVEIMQDMFSNCRALTSLDLSNFNTANVYDMQEMFSNCEALTSLNVSSFNTEKVIKMGAMFEQCNALTTLDVSNFNTASVTDMNEMFRDCTALTSLDLTNFNTTSVTDMGQMFDGCSALTSIDVSNFNMANVTDIHRMFYNNSSLTTIYCNDTWSCGNSTRMFEGCTSLVGAIAYDPAKTDVTYANPDTGYFTRTNETSVSALKGSDGSLKGDAWYSLGGQQLSAPQKGVNIVNGKKVMMK